MIEKRLEEAKRRADLNYFVYINERAAEELEALAKAGRCGKLCGLAVAVKDNIEVAGMRWPMGRKSPLREFLSATASPTVPCPCRAKSSATAKTKLGPTCAGA